jgi:hypothetical protein
MICGKDLATDHGDKDLAKPRAPIQQETGKAKQRLDPEHGVDED